MPDRPILLLLLIDRNSYITFYLASRSLTYSDPEGHNRSHNMNSLKKMHLFQLIFELEISG